MIGSEPFHAMRYTGGRYDCGNRLGFLEANIAVALHRSDTSSETRALLERLLKG
jgi:UTP--glucose-1-phosphate uridylyltransferase